MAAITLTDVSKIDRKGAAVRDVALHVPEGAFCVVTGPTGSGKSTLLRLIASRDRVTSGEIQIGDAIHQSYRHGRRDVAELVDEAALTPRRNIYANIAWNLQKHGARRSEVEARALEAADALRFGPTLDRKARSLSLYEKRRVALARAVARRPRVMLFDEPLAGLDADERWKLRRTIRRIQRETGVTTVYATNDQHDALALADLLAVMLDGRLEQAAPPREIYDRPATTTVARLVGAPAMNVLPVRANQTGLSLEDGTTLGGAGVRTGKTFGFLGVRPEHLFVHREDGPEVGAKFLLDVETVEYAGAESYVHGRVGRFAVTARLAGPPDGVEDGGRITVAAAREHLHMFDAETGARV